MRTGEGVDTALLEAVRRAGLDTVEGAFAFRGGDDLEKAGLARRQRTRFRLEDANGRAHELYLKRYGREPLIGRVRRLLTYGWGGGPAAVEFANVAAARSAGLPTMEAVACDEQAGWCGPVRGYVILTAVTGDALERTFEEFLSRHGDDEAVERLTMKLAQVIRVFHGSGYVHRDLYASHVFLDDSQGRMAVYLIDLARMFRPRWRRFRWRVKDLAQLKYSMPDSWTDRYWEVFLAAYLGSDADRNFARFARAVDRKVMWMRRRQGRKAST
ncbi:MAG: lipopolysaccharide kinase InaA family protein [Planctomycetota bacterium]|jgi:tRNA A-37 threonylcarbamoyl transferase component Bud32